MKFLKRQSAILLIGVFLVVGALASGVVRAQTGGGNSNDTSIPIQTEIIIPGSEPIFDGGLLRGKVGDLANYLGIIYNFLISIVGVVAGVFILIGGFQYLTAGGDVARVTSAKKRIGNALIGFILALSSFVLLNTINPELVNLKLPKFTRIKTKVAMPLLCENLMAQGIEVTNVNKELFRGVAVDRGARCGDFGEFKLPGAEPAYCMFVGTDCVSANTDNPDVPEEQFAYLRTACLPRNIDNFDMKEAVRRARELKQKVVSEGKDDDTVRSFIKIPPLGKCATCAQVTWYASDFYKEYLGYEPSVANSGALCDAWYESSRVKNVTKFGTNIPMLASSCTYDGSARGCVQVDFLCPALKNDCKEYDNASTPVIELKDEFGKYSGMIIPAELDDVPEILEPICKKNPCNLNSGGGGCKPGSFGAVDATRAVIFKQGGENDCENR